VAHSLLKCLGMIKILVVDDDQDMCEILSDFLEEEGYTVMTAYDGESALDEIKTGRYDLLIVDYRLHTIDGLEVLAIARQLNTSLTAIMMTAFGSDATRLHAKTLGAYEFVEKPFDMERMVGVVKQALSKKEIACM